MANDYKLTRCPRCRKVVMQKDLPIPGQECDCGELARAGEIAPVRDFSEPMVGALLSYNRVNTQIVDKKNYKEALVETKRCIEQMTRVVKWLRQQPGVLEDECAREVPVIPPVMPVRTETLVRKFHGAFDIPVADSPMVPPADRRLLRVKLIGEEFVEFAQASGFPVEIWLDTPVGGTRLEYASVLDERLKNVDMIEVADGLGDLDVVVQGSMLEWGFPSQEIAFEIFESNMSKLGSDGKPILREDGKIMKGPTYKKPDIKKLLQPIALDSDSISCKNAPATE